MNLPRIEITRQYALLDMRSKLAKLDVQQPKAELDIQTTPIRAYTHTRYPKVQIDQSEAFAQVGNKTISMLSNEWATQGIQDAQKYAQNVSGKGDRTGNLASREKNVIANMAWERMFHPTSVTVRPAPEVGSVHIEWEMGSRDVQWELAKVDIQVTSHRPMISYEPGSVSIYLKQKAELQIQVVNSGQMDVRI